MKHVLVGKVVNTRGLKGELKILNFSDFKEKRYIVNKNLSLRNPDTNEFLNLTIKQVKFAKDIAYIFFKEINTIEEAENIKNFEVLIEIDNLEKPKGKDEFYYYQLLNLEAIYQNEKIGIVSEIIEKGKNVLKISKKEGYFYVPFVEDFVGEIDLENKKIYLKNLEGLL